jgi:NTE family protein
MSRALSRDGIAVPVEALETVPLFAGLEAADLVGVAASMRWRVFTAGSMLFGEGEPGSAMYVVLEGLINELTFTPVSPLARSRSFFAEGRLVAKHRAGDAVGIMPMITGEPHASTARAVVLTSALELSQADVRALIARFPAILSNLVKILGERLVEANVRYARSPSRGEAVALVVGPRAERSLAAVLAATAAASPRSVEWLDARGSLEEALGRLDGALHEHARVLVVADEAGAGGALLEQVDRAVAVVDERAAGRLAELAGDGQGAALELVLTDGAGDRRRAAGAGTVAGLPVAGTLAGGDGELAPEDLAWLGRHLARAKLGLALGAGGAKGFAHIGALSVLEAAGYTVDCVSGASIGAIVGCCLALGMDSAEIDAKLRAAFDPEAVEQIFKLSFGGGSTGLEAMTRAVEKVTDGRTFEDLRIPLAVMTADLTDRGPRALRDGPLSEALLAATALAGLFPPRERDGHRLVDGLALVPVPTAAAVDGGADVTIAINILGETLPAWPGEEPAPEEAPRRRGGMRTLETLLEVMELGQADASARHAELADIVMTPRFGPGDWRDFEHADRFLAAGRAEAEAHLPALRALACPQPRPDPDQGEQHVADLRVR